MYFVQKPITTDVEAMHAMTDVTRLVTQENGLSFEHDSPPHNMIENRIEETIPEASEYSGKSAAVEYYSDSRWY